MLCESRAKGLPTHHSGLASATKQDFSRRTATQVHQAAQASPLAIATSFARHRTACPVGATEEFAGVPGATTTITGIAKEELLPAGQLVSTPPTHTTPAMAQHACAAMDGQTQGPRASDEL